MTGSAERELRVSARTGRAVASGGTVVAKAAKHLWATWARIAIDQARAARDARERGLAAEPGSPAMGVAFEEEFRAGLQAVTAAAFAIDAWYIAVKDLAPLPSATMERCVAGSGNR